ncbi:MAG: hypothetical protein NUV32_10660 [Exilispira sp.]|jgi:hypothetical protein|nr:hypothetical protein [Exilispira sp.]
MNKSMKIILGIILVIIILSLNTLEDYTVTQKRRNFIIYDNKIDKGIINSILNSYQIFIDNFINKNGLSNLKIEDQELIVIFVKNGIDEVKNINSKIIDKISKNRLNKNKIDFSSIIYDLTIKDKLYLGGIYLPLQDCIIINMKPFNEITFPSIPINCQLLSEYSHYLISKNLEKNFKKRYMDYHQYQKFDYDLHKIKYLFNEAITHFLITYLSQYFKDIEEVNKISDYSLNLKGYSSYFSFVKKVKSNLSKIKPLSEFFMGALSTEDLLIYYLSLFCYIKNNFGLEKILIFINYLYNSNFNSIEEIIKNIFNKDESTFYKEWEEYTKNM